MGFVVKKFGLRRRTVAGPNDMPFLNMRTKQTNSKTTNIRMTKSESSEITKRAELLARAAEKPIAWVYQIDASYGDGYYGGNCDETEELRASAGVRIQISAGMSVGDTLMELRKMISLIERKPSIVSNLLLHDEPTQPTREEAQHALLEALKILAELPDYDLPF